MMKGRPTKCMFQVNHIFIISVLLLHVSALQERHLQGAQRILIKLCVCYVTLGSFSWQHTDGIQSLPTNNTQSLSLPTDRKHTDVIHSIPTDNTQKVSTPYRLTTHIRYPLPTDWKHTDGLHMLPTDNTHGVLFLPTENTQTLSTPYRQTTHRYYPLPTD
jgi:hypothetical protein